MLNGNIGKHICNIKYLHSRIYADKYCTFINKHLIISLCMCNYITLCSKSFMSCLLINARQGDLSSAVFKMFHSNLSLHLLMCLSLSKDLVCKVTFHSSKGHPQCAYVCARVCFCFVTVCVQHTGSALMLVLLWPSLSFFFFFYRNSTPCTPRDPHLLLTPQTPYCFILFYGTHLIHQNA